MYATHVVDKESVRMKDRKQTSLNIDPEIHRQVKVKTAQEGWSVAGLIREAFALYLAGEITKPDQPQETEG